MSRPLRIEYEGAWYHVMNRGAQHRTIFENDDHRQYFLTLLAEVSERFDADIHAYCLMGNHYHLMVRTPAGNLQRIMRQLNGVYTQYFNRSMSLDGSLFRGRYKAILVDAESYWLELSRYIHCNPIEARLVEHLEDYPWSSYLAYIGKANKPDWLSTGYILSSISQQNPVEAYQQFVNEGVSEELHRFYGKKKLDSILSDRAFCAAQLKTIEENHEIPELKKLKTHPSIELIAVKVADHFDMSLQELLTPLKGPHSQGKARAIAMYLCQQKGGWPLSEIAPYFGLQSCSSVSARVNEVFKKIAQGQWLSDINRLLLK